jgi:hypothetical protein
VTSEAASSVKAREDAAWTRGLGYAVAQIIRLHDDPVCAADVILESGLSQADFKAAVDEYDMREIRKLLRTENRLREHWRKI